MRDERKTMGYPYTRHGVSSRFDGARPARARVRRDRSLAMERGLAITVCRHVYADATRIQARRVEAVSSHRPLVGVAATEWDAYLAELHEFSAPGCATLVDVECTARPSRTTTVPCGHTIDPA